MNKNLSKESNDLIEVISNHDLKEFSNVLSKLQNGDESTNDLELIKQLYRRMNFMEFRLQRVEREIRKELGW